MRPNNKPHRHIVLHTILPELGGGELLPGDGGVALGDGDSDTDVGRRVIHRQYRVHNVVLVRQSHAVQTIAGKQVSGMFDDCCLGKTWGPTTIVMRREGGLRESVCLPVVPLV